MKTNKKSLESYWSEVLKGLNGNFNPKIAKLYECKKSVLIKTEENEKRH